LSLVGPEFLCVTGLHSRRTPPSPALIGDRHVAAARSVLHERLKPSRKDNESDKKGRRWKL